MLPCIGIEKMRTSVANADRVDELVEEASAATEPLEDGDTLGTDTVREDLDQEG